MAHAVSGCRRIFAASSGFGDNKVDQIALCQKGGALMSNETDALAQFVAGVMSQIYGLQKGGQDLVDALHLEALAGSRTAKDTLANPWNSSVPPSRRVPDIETQLDKVRGILEEIGPSFLAAVLQKDRLEKQREYQLDREGATGGSATKGDLSLLGPGYQELVGVLRDQARVSDRDAGRVSKKAALQFGRIIKRDGEDRWCDTLVSVRELSRAGLLQHVSVPVGWSMTTGEVWYTERSRYYAHHDPVERALHLGAVTDLSFDAARCGTILPRPIIFDPPGLPRAWTPESDTDMHPVLWDALPDEFFYRSFIREAEERENIALYRPCALHEDEEPTPPFPTLEAMLRFDEDFRAAYQRSDRRFRVLDGHRAGLDGMKLDGLAASGKTRDRELLEWAYPVESDVIFDTPLWDTWRPWGTLLAALKDYLEYPEIGDTGCLVFAWAYYLKGRLARTDAELPVFVRRALFDWSMLPVPSVLAPAVRILVPRDKLKAQPSPDGEENRYM